MKLLFLIPPQIIRSTDGIDVAPTVSIPLGSLYMAAYLRKMEWAGDMRVYDARLGAKTTSYPDGSTTFGDSWDDVAQTIRLYAPDVVAISNMFSWQIQGALDAARISKKTIPEAVTVLGGPHASSFPLKMIEEEALDYVVMGEGEQRLHYLLEALENGETVSLQGILGSAADADLLRPNKKAPIKFIPNLDDLPIPAYDLVDIDRYFHLQSHGYAPRVREYGKRAVTILTSRGCPHQCVFCSIQSTMGYKFRHHSPEYVQAHIRHLIDNYNIDYIHFEDDNFTHDIPRFEKLLDALIDMEKIIPWDTPNGVRADSWTLERIERTKKSGCQHLCIAIESSVQRVIDEVVKKKLDLSKVEPVMAACQKVGLPLSAFFVLGLPGETAAEIKANVDYAIDKYRRYGVYPTFSMANPLPGTELYDTVVEHDLLHGNTLGAPPRANTIKTDEFDPEYIQDIYNYANRQKTAITLKRMLTSPTMFKYFLGLGLRNKWFLKKILFSALKGVRNQLFFRQYGEYAKRL
ncbi:MAG: B12-binding domain-containing radical SAM protein [Rhodospirillaceae bacterium]|nr:B12-binding domain-containing radical SAM protein [Rhodospirillaceae bacterium]